MIIKWFSGSGFRVGIVVFAIILGAWLRWENRTPYKYYPDSYQILLVAQNIRQFGSVKGTLGPEGQLYPPYAMWTRPIYPMLIDAGRFVGFDGTATARYISLLAGIAAIPVGYFAVKSLLKSSITAAIASALLAISFNHAVWSGTIMTESLAVLIVLLLLWSLFSSLKNEPSFADFRDYRTGFLLGISVLTRYEYLLLGIPIGMLLVSESPKPWIRAMNILAAALLVISVVLSLLFPVGDVIQALYQQYNHFFSLPTMLIGILVCGILLFIYSRYSWSTKFLSAIRLPLLTFIWILTAGLIIQILWHYRIPVFSDHFEALRNFIRNDFSLYLFAVIGFTFLIYNRSYMSTGYALLVAVLLLEVTYARVNPAMDRYWTHVLPFLLIPASWGIYRLLRFSVKKAWFIPPVIITALLILQAIITYTGFRSLNDVTWFEPSYEESSARILSQQGIDKQTVIIAPLPEPYYFFTGLSTDSISDIRPFVYLGGLRDDRQIVIVEDLAMRRIFPHFSRFLDADMSTYAYRTYRVNKPFHYLGSAIRETKPVILYRITLGDLKAHISTYSASSE